MSATVHRAGREEHVLRFDKDERAETDALHPAPDAERRILDLAREHGAEAALALLRAAHEAEEEFRRVTTEAPGLVRGFDFAPLMRKMKCSNPLLCHLFLSLVPLHRSGKVQVGRPELREALGAAVPPLGKRPTSPFPTWVHLMGLQGFTDQSIADLFKTSLAAVRTAKSKGKRRG